ncbi:MAG: TonB-dependent receptor [Flammeovirgaceae bacterium]
MLHWAVWAQDRTVTGKVLSASDNSPLPGVSVVVKGTTTGTVTDIDGNYKLILPSGATTLVYSFIGFQTKEVVVGTQSVVDVIISEDVKQLDEVIVTGYGGEQIKQDVTGNIAKVASKDIQNSPVPTFEQAMQGRAAGVHIEAGNGKIGGGIKVRIRGSSSISASNEPLYVVDGMIITSENFQGTSVQRNNPLAEINPSDIASVEILKDASAAAIYGSRAANGVVIITTKKGKAGATKFNFGIQNGRSKPTNKRDFLNSTQYMDLMREAGENADDLAFALSRLRRYTGGNIDPANAYDPNNPDDYSMIPNTNWQDLVFNDDAGFSQIDFSATGGTDKTRYFASGQRSKQDGILIGNSMERYSGRLNLDHTYEKFTLGISLGVTHNSLKKLADDNEFSTPMQIVALPPISKVRQPNGEYTNNTVASGRWLPYYNPLISLDETKYETKTFRTLGTAFASYEILKGLSIRTEFGLDFQGINEDRYWGINTLEGQTVQRQGSSIFDQTINYNSTTFLTWTKNIADKHDLTVTAGQTFQKSRNEANYIQGQNFPSNAFKKIFNAAVRSEGSSTTTEYTFLSYFARANYKFMNRYLVSLSGRVDGSSRFGENNRYGFFPAASLGWIISQEDFLKDNSVISFLKLRASYGIVGNAGIGNFAHLQLLGAADISGSSGYAGSAGIRPTQIANPDLGWETTAQTDIGFDFGVLNDRITGEIDYYIKKTDDLLLNVPVPATSGFASKVANVGSLENKGIEIVINTINVSKGDFKWTTNFNIAFNRNKITNLGADQIIDNRGSRLLNVVKVGEPLGAFYGREYAGVNPANGDAIYFVNGEVDPGEVDGVTVFERNGRFVTNDPNRAKDVYLGNPNPKYVGGLTNSITYKGLELSVLFQFVNGNKVYNAAGGFMTASFDWFDNQTTDILNRWQNPGDETNVPQLRLGLGNGTSSSSYYLYDASYVRLKNIQLAYNLPKEWLSVAKLSNARVFVSAQNLLTFTDYTGWDPEVNTDYLGNGTTNFNVFQGVDFYSAPQPKTWTVGVNVGF